MGDGHRQGQIAVVGRTADASARGNKPQHITHSRTLTLTITQSIIHLCSHNLLDDRSPLLILVVLTHSPTIITLTPRNESLSPTDGSHRLRPSLHG